MIDMSYDPEYERRNPTRSLRWRWRRAQLLVARGCQFRRNRDDEFTGLAIYYLRGRARCRSDRQLLNLARRHPDLHAALRLHVDGGLDRWEVEARLLAREDSKVIGRFTDLTAATVETFESLFFNVRDRFNARSYILTAAIGRIGSVGDVKDHRAVFLRTIGYFGGPFVLGMVLEQLGTLLDLSANQGDSTTTDDILAQRIRLLMAARSAEFDDHTALQLASIGSNYSSSKPVQNGHVFAQEVVETLEKVFQKMPIQPPDTSRDTTAADGTLHFGEVA